MDNRKADGIPMVICAAAPGCFEIDPESGEPLESFAYWELTQLGYTSASLASAGGKGATSINFLYGLIYPGRFRDQPIEKMHPERLKLASILQKWKLKQASLTSENAVGKEEEGAFSLAYIRRKSATPNENIPKAPRAPTSQTGGYGEESRIKFQEIL